ncbi:hypothetical protein B0H12DRAFT_1140264 [Mycena haematopus]|nr:hypothetical protein B0H12DRAFT_1140264 [Mycena haematopus]
MIQATRLLMLVCVLVAGSVTALPLNGRQFGLISPAEQASKSAALAAIQSSVSASFLAASTAAAAAEATSGVDIAALVAAASSSAAAAAQITSTPESTISPEEVGELAGLEVQLKFDTQFGDAGAIQNDNDLIQVLESEENPVII